MTFWLSDLQIMTWTRYKHLCQLFGKYSSSKVNLKQKLMILASFGIRIMKCIVTDIMQLYAVPVMYYWRDFSNLPKPLTLQPAAKSLTSTNYLTTFLVLLGVYTFRSSDRPVGPTDLSDRSVRRSYRVNAQLRDWFCKTITSPIEHKTPGRIPVSITPHNSLTL